MGAGFFFDGFLGVDLVSFFDVLFSLDDFLSTLLTCFFTSSCSLTFSDWELAWLELLLSIVSSVCLDFQQVILAVVKVMSATNNVAAARIRLTSVKL